MLISFLCSIVEYAEFLVIKTDQTILAANVLCKLFIIALLIIVLWRRRQIRRALDLDGKAVKLENDLEAAETANPDILREERKEVIEYGHRLYRIETMA